MTMPMQWALRRRMMMAASGGVDVANLLIQGSCTFTDYGVVTMGDGNDYRLLAITQSGNLAIFEPDGISTCPVNCEVCVVGGGANGSRAGGAGGYLKNQVIADYSGGAIVVGAAQGASSIGGINVDPVSGKNGGTGGGGFGPSSIVGGKGDGLLKYPFGESEASYELWKRKPHCAGGAGGSNAKGDNGNYYMGGPGGANGLDGGDAIKGTDTGSMTGGSYGGGNGGSANIWGANAGTNGSYYGAGGGGGGCNTHTNASGGSGYQGIVYVRIPVEQ